MHRSQSVRHVKVTTDGEGVTSHAGTVLLAELADRSGLTRALSVAMGDCGISWHTHDPGVVLTHLAVAIADGADCLSKLAVLRNQEALFGPVASHPTAWRAVEAVAAVELAGIDAARATARERIWAAGGAPASVTLDFDATLVDAHSEKQYAKPTYKRGFGFHPLGVWCDETTEFLAGMLRPGNAGANNAADHVKMLDAALAQLPPQWRAGHAPGDHRDSVAHPILVRADSAGATHGFVDALVARNIGFSIGFDVDGRVRDALMLVQEEDWEPAVEADGRVRRGAWVTELTGLVDLGTWPADVRLICRRERPHPGAQLSLFDTSEGFRHTCFLTRSAGEPPPLELRQRRHARVEDRIRCAKASGLRNFPFEDFVRNEAWLAMVMVGQDLLAWTATLCLDGALARAEPATLRYQILHVAARLARRGRDLHLRIDETWPWRDQLDAAFGRLRTALC
ncbi:MAG: IS1380 family transposase [Acidimicrobiales bacterium]|nr:IS1380 family transposase [Acidimicrobiales bacterium]